MTLATVLLLVSCIAGLLLLPFGLPGLWVMVLGVLACGWLTDFLPGIEWNRMIEVGVIQNILGLLFWGYLVYVLMQQPVKNEFLPAGTSSR